MSAAKVWNGTSWEFVGSAPNAQIQPNPPTGPAIGQLWLDSDDIQPPSNVDSGWLIPTLLGTWTNYLTPTYPQAAYRKLNGVVYLQGLVKGGAALSGIFVLPAGFRPTVGTNLFNGVDGVNVMSRIDIEGSTGMVAHQAGNTNFISLNSIRFVADN